MKIVIFSLALLLPLLACKQEEKATAITNRLQPKTLPEGAERPDHPRSGIKKGLCRLKGQITASTEDEKTKGFRHYYFKVEEVIGYGSTYGGYKPAKGEVLLLIVSGSLPAFSPAELLEIDGKAYEAKEKKDYNTTMLTSYRKLDQE